MIRSILTNSERNEISQIQDTNKPESRSRARKKARNLAKNTKRAFNDILLLQNLIKFDSKGLTQVHQDNEWKSISGRNRDDLYTQEFENMRDEFFQTLKTNLPSLVNWLTPKQREELAQEIVTGSINIEREELEEVRYSIEQSVKEEKESKELDEVLEKFSQAIDSIFQQSNRQIEQFEEKIIPLLPEDEREIIEIKRKLEKEKGRHLVDKYYVFKEIALGNPKSNSDVVKLISEEKGKKELREKIKSSNSEDSTEAINQKLKNNKKKSGKNSIKSYAKTVSQYCSRKKEPEKLNYSKSLSYMELIERPNQSSYWKLTQKGEKVAEFLFEYE